ncbi:MAG: Spy/CpxP family protein refolding chaperone [Azonexus sp.]
MNTYRKIVPALLLALGIGALAAGPALADRGCDSRESRAGWQAKKMEQHHTQLHDALKLSAEQEPGWTKLLASEQHGPAVAGAGQEDWSKLNAPERAEKMLELSKARQAGMAEHVAALKAFYGSLTPQQQKVFEEFHSGHHHGHHAHHGMRGKPAAKAPASDAAPVKP